MATQIAVQTDDYINTFHSIDFERITNHPNILIAASFWDTERYNAAKTCYKLMRSIDDLIDDHKCIHKTISPDQKGAFEISVNNWITNILSASPLNSDQKDLVEKINRFHIPFWPLEEFASSMVYDIYNDGFPTLESFLDYAVGASIAPASIFVHLSGLTKENGHYLPPVFNVKKAATPCAIFSYLVHIIRDFQKDHLNNLNYFPDDIMENNGLNRKELLLIAQGEPLNPGFRNMMGELYQLADFYRKKTIEMKQEIKPFLDQKSQLSLEIIYDLYLMVFDRIDIENGKFTTDELNPTPIEIKERVMNIIVSFRAVN
jgi:phytoene/squalene synthetase